MKKLVFSSLVCLMLSTLFASSYAMAAERIIEVTILRTYQDSKYAAKVNIEIANKSDEFVDRVTLDVNAYDANGKFLAQGITARTNMQAHTSAIDSAQFSNINADNISTYKIQIRGISITIDGKSYLPADNNPFKVIYH